MKNFKHYLEEIPVFFSSDDNYVPYLAVSIQSLIDTASENYKYSIYILNDKLNLENRKSLKSMETKNVKINFVDVTRKIKNIYTNLKEQLRDYYSPSIYYRLFIASMFPRYKKAIYLDCDITIIEDIANMYKIDIGNNILGVIPDEVVKSNDLLKEYVERAVGVEWQKYFNSGVLLMNLDRFRAYKLEDKFIYYLKNYPFSSVAPDQDYLNILCKDKVQYIDRGWDRMTIPDESFDDSTLKLVHYNMFQKPWRYTGVMYEKYFWKVAKETKYYEQILNTLNSYTAEQKQKDLESAGRMIENAVAVMNNPNNFKNTVERKMNELHASQEEQNEYESKLDYIYERLANVAI